MTEEQRTIYTGVLTARNIDVNLRWSISQLFILVNSAGFSVIATQFKTMEPLYYYLICAGGFSVAILWSVIALRLQNLINYWNGRLALLELTDTQPIRVFSDPFIRVRPFLTTHSMLLWLIRVFAIVWFVSGALPIVLRR